MSGAQWAVAGATPYMNRNPCRRRVAHLSDCWTAGDPSESFTPHGGWCTSGARVVTESCALVAEPSRRLRIALRDTGVPGRSPHHHRFLRPMMSRYRLFRLTLRTRGPVSPPLRRPLHHERRQSAAPASPRLNPGPSRDIWTSGPVPSGFLMPFERP